MIVTPFTSDFYTIFPAPNVEELTEFCNKKSKSEVRNDLFSWGKLCKVDRVPLLWEEVIDLYKPSMEILSQQLNKSFQYTMFNPWLNLYKKNYYQEIHDHHEHDISSVFFVNDGVDFSKFFFYDRHSLNFSETYEELISYKNTFEPDIKKGDIIFFSSHLLHGVTTHQSDEIRKTLSLNFVITDITGDYNE
tara:strand:- start:39 stop:611 length:573 start_codon:yes stop_codon:yes gene_type:complete